MLKIKFNMNQIWKLYSTYKNIIKSSSIKLTSYYLILRFNMVSELYKLKSEICLTKSQIEFQDFLLFSNELHLVGKGKIWSHLNMNKKINNQHISTWTRLLNKVNILTWNFKIVGWYWSLSLQKLAQEMRLFLILINWVLTSSKTNVGQSQ